MTNAYERERRLAASLGLERERCEQLESEIEAARKVANAAVDWADAQKAYEAGAGGAAAYLRAREQLLLAAVREYRENGAMRGGEMKRKLKTEENTPEEDQAMADGLAAAASGLPRTALEQAPYTRLQLRNAWLVGWRNGGGDILRGVVVSKRDRLVERRSTLLAQLAEIERQLAVLVD